MAVSVANSLYICQENQTIRAITLCTGNGHLIAINVKYGTASVSRDACHHRKVVVLYQQFQQAAVRRYWLAYLPQRGVKLDRIN